LKDKELQQAQTLIKSSDPTSQKNKDIQDLKNTISQKDNRIQKLEETICQKKKNIQDAQNTIAKRNKTIENLKNEANNLKSNPNYEPLGISKNQRNLEQENFSKGDEIRTLENQLAHRDHVVRTLESAYENLEKSSEERIATLWDELKAKDRELGELRNCFEKERLGWRPETQDNTGSKTSGQIKKEKQLKIKPEPMEY
jgi:chromosome segregation ATPase